MNKCYRLYKVRSAQNALNFKGKYWSKDIRSLNTKVVISKCWQKCLIDGANDGMRRETKDVRACARVCVGTMI